MNTLEALPLRLKKLPGPFTDRISILDADNTLAASVHRRVYESPDDACNRAVAIINAVNNHGEALRILREVMSVAGHHVGNRLQDEANKVLTA